MKTQQHGVITLVSSDQSFVAKPNSAVYGLSKAALAQLAKSTAVDYAEFNIRVNCVCPGTIDTPLYRRAIAAYSEKYKLPLARVEQAEANEQPLKRIGKSSEVASLIHYLSCDQAAFITGSAIPIDGGLTAI